MPRNRDVSERFFEPDSATSREQGKTTTTTTTPPTEARPPAEPESQKGQTASEGGNESQATALVRLAEEVGAELFHNSDGDAYARIWARDHHEVWRLSQKKFKVWLRRLFYAETGKSPNSQAMQDALGVLEGKAVFAGEQHDVHTRVTEHDGAVYHDLANELWEAVEVTESGWRVVSDPPVRFRRTRAMLPLPHPTSGGSLEALLPFINADTDEDFVLFVGWLVQSLRARGPYIGYEAIGEQGSAKTTRGRIARKLIDPNAAPVRSAPRDEDDLVIAATNSWVITLDNLSYLSDWLSDGLCRLATGGGLSKRQLYTDADEIVLDAQRPVFITSIEEVATRGDLLDRLIVSQVPRLSDDKLRPETELWAEFDQLWPSLYGALLDAVACALRNLPDVKLDRHPRMADAARWVTAAEPALGWEPGTFLRVYEENRQSAHDVALEASPLAHLLRSLAAKGFNGTPTDLLERLRGLAEDDQLRAKWFPKNAVALGGALARLAPALRATGIEVTRDRESGGKSGGKRSRIVSLRMAPQPAVPLVPPVTPAVSDGPDEGTTPEGQLPLGGDARPPSPSPESPLPEPRRDDGDEGDAPPHPRSGLRPDAPRWELPDAGRAVRAAHSRDVSAEEIAKSFSFPLAIVLAFLAEDDA
jgi:hypothetical protein